MKKYEVFYISNHGFGHLTRCLAKIEEILETTNRNVYIACGKRQTDFAKLYLFRFKDRITFSDIQTDVGFINKPNSLKIDKELLERKLYEFIDSINLIVNNEVKKLQLIDFDEINVDVSPVGVLVGKSLNKSVVMTTNFTWYSQYKHLNLDNKILNFYKSIDLKVDKLRKYPLNFGLEHFTCESEEIDFICRKISQDKVNRIRKKFGKSIMVSVGKSATIGEIEIVNFDGTIFYTEGIKVKSDANTVKLPIDTIDTQNYIAASELVIAKAGWSTISECIIAKTPMLLIERPDSIEDMHNIKKIISMKKGSSIKEKNLKKIDVMKFLYTRKE